MRRTLRYSVFFALTASCARLTPQILVEFESTGSLPSSNVCVTAAEGTGPTISCTQAINSSVLVFAAFGTNRVHFLFPALTNAAIRVSPNGEATEWVEYRSTVMQAARTLLRRSTSRPGRLYVDCAATPPVANAGDACMP